MPPSRKPSPGRRVGLPEVCVALAGLVSVMPTPAQSPVSRREFEVASIRLNVKGGPWVFNGQKSPGTFASENQTLRALIQEAYGRPSGKRNWLPVFVAAGTGTPILGGPDWIGSARYDITAKWNAAPDAYRTVESINKTQVEMDLMLRALLEQRFKLKLHRETRELPVYELRIAKAGKLRQGTCATYNPANPPLSTPDPQPVIYCGGSSLGRERVGLDTGWRGDENGRPGEHSFLPDRHSDRDRQDRVCGNLRCPPAVDSRPGRVRGNSYAPVAGRRQRVHFHCVAGTTGSDAQSRQRSCGSDRRGSRRKTLRELNLIVCLEQTTYYQHFRRRGLKTLGDLHVRFDEGPAGRGLVRCPPYDYQTNPSPIPVHPRSFAALVPKSAKLKVTPPRSGGI